MSASGGHVKKKRVSKKHHYLSEPNDFDDSDGEKRDTDIEKRKKHRHVAEHNVTFAEETPSEENEEFPFLLNEHRSEKRKKKGAKTGEGEAVQRQDDEPEMQITSYNTPVRESEGFPSEKKQKRKDSQAEFDQVDVNVQGRSERKKRKRHRESFAEVYSACEAENGSQLSGAGGNEESPSCTAQGTERHVAKGKRRPSSDPPPSAAVLEAAFYSDDEGSSSPPDPLFLEYLNGTHGYPAIHCKTKPSAEMISLYEAEQGLSLDYGKYTADEDGILLRNVHDIAAYYKIRFPYMIVGHCGDYSREVQKQVKKLVKDYNLVRMLGRGLPCRTLHSAYMRARILLDPHNEVAKNIPTSHLKEQVERLYAQMGAKWTEMAQKLGITAEHCRSILRHDQEKKTFATGAWTKEEDDLLQQAMEEQSSGGSLKLSAIDWQKVSQCVGRRTAQQCRRRWTLLQLKPDISSAMRKWSPYDTIHLIWRMHKLNPPRSSAVDWDKLVEYFPWAQSASIPRYYWQTTVDKYLSLEDRADFQTKVKNLYERALPRLLDKHGNGRTVSEIVKLSKSSNTVPVHPQDDD
ncbi:uncharacterized protein LOC144153469 isoform X2 [Haemaphysalis longicornis]